MQTVRQIVRTRRKGADYVAFACIAPLMKPPKNLTCGGELRGCHKMCSLEEERRRTWREKEKKTRPVFGMYDIRGRFLSRRSGASRSSYIGAVISGFILSSLAFLLLGFIGVLPCLLFTFVSITAVSLCCRLESAAIPVLHGVGRSAHAETTRRQLLCMNLALIEVACVHFNLLLAIKNNKKKSKMNQNIFNFFFWKQMRPLLHSWRCFLDFSIPQNQVLDLIYIHKCDTLTRYFQLYKI